MLRVDSCGYSLNEWISTVVDAKILSDRHWTKGQLKLPDKLYLFLEIQCVIRIYHIEGKKISESNHTY